MGSRSLQLRRMMADVMEDGEWLLARDIIDRLNNAGYSKHYKSGQQVGSLCTATPGFENKKSTQHATYNRSVYRLVSRARFDKWLEEQKAKKR
jgi:hypothetical protein